MKRLAIYAHYDANGEIKPYVLYYLKELKKLTHQEIIDKVDHKNLNVDVDFLKDIIPTAENLAIKFWEILEPKITKGRLHEIKLYESERNYVVYRGGCL